MTNDEYMALNLRVLMTQGHIEKLLYERDYITKDPQAPWPLIPGGARAQKLTGGRAMALRSQAQ